MMRAMKRNQEMTEDDLLMLPPIDGLVHEIKGELRCIRIKAKVLWQPSSGA